MRKHNQIPGVYYSHDSKRSIPFYILESEFKKAKNEVHDAINTVEKDDDQKTD